MQRILWLASWYPSKISPFDGDFVRRHAIAVSRLMPVTLIHVVKDDNALYTSDVKIEEVADQGLHEIIAYYKPPVTGSLLLNRVLSFRKFRAVYKKVIQNQISENGLPCLTHVHVPMRAGIIGKWLKKRYALPLIVTEHWCGYNELNADNFFNRSMMFRMITRSIFASADLVTMVCEANRKELLSIFKISRSVVITNVGDVNAFYVEAPAEGAEFTFVHVSSLTYQKNIEGILKAMMSLPEQPLKWKLLIIGPYNQQQYELAVQFGLKEYTTWLGELPYEQVAFYVRKASCMVMFSRFENLPCTLVEALLCGVPVIATKVGGIPEIINEANGLLVESENIEGLSQAINTMLTMHSSYDRPAISSAAEKKFSYEVVAQQFVKAYRDVIPPNKVL